MRFRWSVAAAGAIALFSTLGASPGSAEMCPEPVLSRFQTHTLAAGETLASVATQYRLQPTTLLSINANLRQAIQRGGWPVGQTIQVPPYNGRIVTVDPGTTWQEAAARFNSRDDILFELNGCAAAVPDRLFVPGVVDQVSRSGQAAAPDADSDPLSSYPLPVVADIVTSYGWQPHPVQEELVFSPGVGLRATPGTDVLAAGAGTVAFVGANEVYGDFVVINHAQGLQTRYGNLQAIRVQRGQTVQPQTVIAQVQDPGVEQESPFMGLFFEVRLNSELGWVAQDPQTYIPALGLR